MTTYYITNDRTNTTKARTKHNFVKVVRKHNALQKMSVMSTWFNINSALHPTCMMLEAHLIVGEKIKPNHDSALELWHLNRE